MTDSVQARLDELAAVDRGRPRKWVTIIGSGMAGLVAAHELEQLGHTVRVYEASGETRGAPGRTGLPTTATASSGPCGSPSTTTTRSTTSPSASSTCAGS